MASGLYCGVAKSTSLLDSQNVVRNWPTGVVLGKTCVRFMNDQSLSNYKLYDYPYI